MSKITTNINDHIIYRKTKADGNSYRLQTFLSKRISHLSSLLGKDINQLDKIQILTVIKTLNKLMSVFNTISTNQKEKYQARLEPSINHLQKLITKYIEKNIDLETVLKYF